MTTVILIQWCFVMKALFAVVLCAVVSSALGSAVSWPGAAVALSSPLLNTLAQPSTKSFAYSTTQYINALPASYSYGIRPQLAYPISQVSAFAPIPGLPAYYPVSSASYFPASGVVYPQLSPITPIRPPQPAPSPPSAPIAPIGANPPEQPIQPSLPSGQPAGDADTTVIESAEFLNAQQGNQQEESRSANPNQSQAIDNAAETKNQDQQPEGPVSPLYRNPQIVQQASFPSIPQLPQGIAQSQWPQSPQFAQLPQWPQLPQFPQFPQFPELPQFPPSQSSPPQIPQQPSLPQFPPSQSEPSQPQLPQQPSVPQFPPSQGGSLSPQLPQLPSFPGFPPSLGDSTPQQPPQLPSFPPFPPTQLPNFPSADNSNKDLNDEDTVAVDSA